MVKAYKNWKMWTGRQAGKTTAMKQLPPAEPLSAEQIRNAADWVRDQSNLQMDTIMLEAYRDLLVSGTTNQSPRSGTEARLREELRRTPPHPKWLKPSEVEAVFEKIKYKDWRFQLTRTLDGDLIELCIWFYAPDAVKDVYGSTRKQPVQTTLYLNPFAHTEKSLLHEVFHAIKHLELHEAGEWFRYDGKMIFDPHKGQGFP